MRVITENNDIVLKLNPIEEQKYFKVLKKKYDKEIEHTGKAEQIQYHFRQLFSLLPVRCIYCFEPLGPNSLEFSLFKDSELNKYSMNNLIQLDKENFLNIEINCFGPNHKKKYEGPAFAGALDSIIDHSFYDIRSKKTFAEKRQQEKIESIKRWSANKPTLNPFDEDCILKCLTCQEELDLLVRTDDEEDEHNFIDNHIRFHLLPSDARENLQKYFELRLKVNNEVQTWYGQKIF